ncbi:MAG: glutamate--tRNA ligase [Rhodospirillales bacterium]|jgi:glutamyl-tRNA synthetase|nr:glutamate--tRNA ligase [Rhodospirillales bacterium]MBT3907338.1 glutamate--tRNA ligase [Rhodospirillaceae bacterium]MBT5035005.1 glutamate--tRNA ligase [Rhodospirillaceae bacterium]MBT6221782.1 glutamate--tRNA ligase [Rhodospirillaceae bacterium]MBT6361906.1 glutamate--tRNA ligase [Rhodospirillaceae bacterium]
MTVVTRFAPSPTGFLHIGGVRTALYNWLFARHHGGKFLLRIEDTDRKRSSDDAVAAILDGLKWMALDWDGDAISQFARVEDHKAAVERLLGEGNAYRCYCSPEELTQMREEARAKGTTALYDGRWRDRDPSEAPDGVDPVIRLKTPNEGETVIEDLVQGTVRVANNQLDDMVLMRADGTPTYMLAVVIDDHDMGVTHAIRGDDHLTNAFRQSLLFDALGWERPEFAHIPLIHGADGAKLSKRHGALGVEAYRDDGFLPEAVFNYLLRLGWSHGDDEIISREQAVEWFDLGGVGKSPARFDIDKLTSLNGHYIRHGDNERLSKFILPVITEKLGGRVAEGTEIWLNKGLDDLKERAKTIIELADSALFYAKTRPLTMDEKATTLLSEDGIEKLCLLHAALADIDDWSADRLKQSVGDLAEAQDLKLGKLLQPLRAALTGTHVSPGMFDVMAVLGREESLGRLDDVLN